MAHDYHELENVLRHERCLELEDCLLPRSVAADPGPTVVVGGTYTLSQLQAMSASLKCHHANAAESFEVLGKLLANMEQRLRSFTDGTEEEQLVCSKRYVEETRELSTKAAEVLGELKRQVFAESEKYKELNRENQ